MFFNIVSFFIDLRTFFNSINKKFSFLQVKCLSLHKDNMHRYCKPHLAKKCVRKRPSKTVMFYFAPTNFAFQKMREICFDAVVDQPKKFFPFPNSKNKPSSSGLLEFENVTQALECIAKCNHVELPQAAGGYSVKLRLCFAERCIPENA